MRLMSIFLGNGLTAVITLGRNLAAAYLLSLEDYGLATTFFIVISLAEMLTQFGQSVLIVADRTATGSAALARYHAFNVLRSLAAGALIAAGSWFLAPTEDRALYLALALVPAIGGFQHFRQFQLQQLGKARLAVTLAAAAAASSLVVMIVAAKILPDARAVVVALVAQAVVLFALSHVFSDEPYTLRFDRADLLQDVRTGLPLLLNGGALFLILFGERLIVARGHGLETLGYFAMGVTLTLTPSIVLSKSLMTRYLPDLVHGRASVRTVVTAHVGAAFILIAALVIGLPIFIHLALPPSFAPLLVLVPLLALQQGLRLARGSQAVVGIALGHRKDELWVSAARLVVLPVMAASTAAGLSIAGLVVLSIVGEALGLVVALVMIARRSAPRTLGYGAP